MLSPVVDDADDGPDAKPDEADRTVEELEGARSARADDKERLIGLLAGPGGRRSIAIARHRAA